MNTTVATLVRILDEERNERQTAMADLNSMRYNFTSMEKQFQEELRENSALRADIRDINTQLKQRDGTINSLNDQVNAHLTIFQTTERMQEAIERLVFEDLDIRIPELRKELGVNFNLIAVIKQVREKFGLNLKTSRDLVYSHRAKEDGLCPECSRGENHSLFGHGPKGCPIKFCSCRNW
jgi:chromosome segregation ATPase